MAACSRQLKQGERGSDDHNLRLLHLLKSWLSQTGCQGKSQTCLGRFASTGAAQLWMSSSLHPEALKACLEQGRYGIGLTPGMLRARGWSRCSTGPSQPLQEFVWMDPEV